MSGRFPGGEMHILPFRVPAGKVSWSSYSTSTSVTKPCSFMPFHCSKSKTSTICKRCEQNVASYGKPTRWDKMQFNEIVETKPKYFAAASFANCRLPLWAANVSGAAATTRLTNWYSSNMFTRIWIRIIYLQIYTIAFPVLHKTHVSPPITIFKSFSPEVRSAENLRPMQAEVGFWPRGKYFENF